MKYKINLDIIELEKRNYHVFIELKIGEKMCRLLLDTGASKTVFDTERVLRFVKESNIKANESKSVGLGVSEMETRTTVLKKLQMRKLFIKKMEVAVLPISHVNTTYQALNIPEIDGVLGSDFLMKHEAVIDYGKGVLRMNG